MGIDDSDKHRTLGGYIAARRQTLNLSQRQLAARAGLHHSFIARLENGENVARTPEHLQWIADALSVDVSELLRFVGVTPGLPEPRVYFRRKLGVNAKTAEVLARLAEDNQLTQFVEEYQARQQGRHGRGNEDEENND